MLLGIVPLSLLLSRCLRASSSERAVRGGPRTHSQVNAVRAPMLLGIVPLS
jgi:hypothetical protein